MHISTHVFVEVPTEQAVRAVLNKWREKEFFDYFSLYAPSWPDSRHAQDNVKRTCEWFEKSIIPVAELSKIKSEDDLPGQFADARYFVPTWFFDPYARCVRPEDWGAVRRTPYFKKRYEQTLKKYKAGYVALADCHA